MTVPGRGRTGAERVRPTFAGDPAHVFLRENGQTWTVGRLLAYANDILQQIPEDTGPLVAVRSHTAAFVFASLIAFWRTGRSPLLIDPELASEPLDLRTPRERMLVIAPSHVTDRWCDLAISETGGPPVVPAFPAPDDGEVAFFTSGSTGEPKIVRKKAYQFGEQHVVEAPWLGLDAPLQVLSLVHAFHILGYIYGFDMPACGRGTTTFYRGGAPQQWVEQIRAHRPALVVAVPSHYRLMNQVLSEPLPLSTYLCSGAPLDPAISEEFERLAGSPVLQVYGSTETGGIATRLNGGPWRIFPEMWWRSRESDGRLLIKSAWQEKPEEWYTTGDAAAPEGDTFRLLGRADSVVKVGGRRFSTGEVVQAALADPRIEQAHAIAYSRFGELAVALFVVPRKNVPLTAADMRSALAGRLARFKIPRTIEVLTSLPTRGIGKIDEEALRALVSPDDTGQQRAVSSQS